MEKTATDQLLTVGEVAKRTRLAERTVRELIARGQLRIVRPGGLRAVRISERALAEFMARAERRTAATSEGRD